jgi:hypothetical protein
MKRVFITDHLEGEVNKSGSMKTIQAAQKSQKQMGRIEHDQKTLAQKCGTMIEQRSE